MNLLRVTLAAALLLSGCAVVDPLAAQADALARRLGPSGVSVTRVGDEISMQLPDITFDTGRASLKAEYRSMLEDMALILSEYPETTIAVTGHTDSTGGPQVNQRLSESRARTVADFLRRQAIGEDRIVSVIGVGEAQPVASNETVAGREQNRRVEVRLRQRG